MISTCSKTLVAVVALVVANALLLACKQLPPCAGRSVAPGEGFVCPVPGWFDRSFDVAVPPNWDRTSPLPVLFAFHGGGGNKNSAQSTTCRDGNVDDATCLAQAANRKGILVIRPDGTGGRPLRNVRTWNSGGGINGLNCASGSACAEGIDDIAFFDEVLAEVGRIVPIDPSRVYLTGLSNGASMSHRLACERADRIAAIVPVGGANQFAAAGGACTAQVPIMHIHGTEDPCWTYASSSITCVTENGVKIGVDDSMEGWRVRNGCTAERDEIPLADRDPNDGTHVVRLRYRGCDVDTEHLRVEGGGHTWPSGNQYFPVSKIGRITRDIDSEEIVSFLIAHPKK